MNELQIFKSPKFKQVRMILIDDEPWFVGKDVAENLGYSNSRDAIQRHLDKDDVVKHDTIDNLGRKQETTLINESGVYSLILSSKLPQAKAFKKWVTSEILPSIRKTGIYINTKQAENLLGDPDFMIQVFCELKKEKEKVKELKPKADYYDTALQSKSLIPITTIAKEFGLSAVKLNKLLKEWGVQYSKGGRWHLYQKYADKGYTGTRTVIITAEKSDIRTYWTQKGRKFIHELLQKNLGITIKVG